MKAKEKQADHNQIFHNSSPGFVSKSKALRSSFNIKINAIVSGIGLPLRRKINSWTTG
jgi:hypothetical protein